MIYPDEYFKKYWKKRLYKHPEENNKKTKRKARIFYYAGFSTGSFYQRKEDVIESKSAQEKGK